MLGPVWVVVPTYNEAANLQPFVEALLDALSDVDAVDRRVLVVDDASPDGTGLIADRLADAHDGVEVLHRPSKDGLGRAYLRGFQAALVAGADRVIEIDADFSHDPADVPRLLDTSREVDVAIGSRYVRGGSVAGWGAVRRLLSRGGCAYARRALGMDVRDLTGGLKCFRREVLEAIDLPSVRSRGYAFQVELTYRALRRGFEVREIPVTFSERRAGQSKMSARIALEAALLVPVLRLRERSGDGPRRAPEPLTGELPASPDAAPRPALP